MVTHSSVRSTPQAAVWPLLNSPLLVAAVIFILTLAPRLLNLDVFVGPDEFTWDERSANFTHAIVNGNWAETYQDGYPGVTLMWVETAGAWLRYGAQRLSGPADWEAIVGPADTMANLSHKRQVLAGFNALLVVAGVLLVQRLFGSRVAWLAGFLWAFDPFLLTESRVLRSEGILTGFMSLAVLSVLLYVRRPSLRYALLAGALTALAVLSKVSGMALLPVGGLAIGAAAWWDGPLVLKARLQKVILAWLVWGGAAALTLFIVWPALWVGPLEVARQMYAYVDVRVTEGNEGGQSFFMGEPRADEEVGPIFFPVALLYRTTPFQWLGLLLLPVIIWLAWRNRRDKQVDAAGLALSAFRLLALLSVLLLFLAVYLAMISGSTLKYDRFIIPMLPILNVLAAVGLVYIWQWFIKSPLPQGYAVSNLSGLLATLLVLVIQFAFSWPHHPYYYTYWNPLLGGLPAAAQVLPVGVGEGLDQAAAYLNGLPQAEHIKLALANSTKIEPIFKGQTIALDNQDGRWAQADYVLIYISQLQRAKHDPNLINYLRRQAPVFTVTLHGLEYAWLYPGPAAQHYGGGYKLEGRGTLLGYSFLPSPERRGAGGEVVAGETLPMHIFWRNEGQLETDRFFVRLLDVDGYVWTEALVQPRPGFEEANRQRESIVDSEAVLSLPVGMPPGDYFLKPGFRTDSGEIIGYFELPGDTKPMHVTRPESYPPAEAVKPAHPTQLTAHDEVSLLDYNLEPEVVAPGAATWATLYWQALRPVKHDYVILVRLVAPQGQELAYWLGRPVRSGYPTTEWAAGQFVQDPWRLTIPAGAKAGTYNLEVALFDAASEAEVARQTVGRLQVSQ
ncbi:MAG: phospholipid carrier-dependent glycosyltransferase [Anaerolineae bacterium]